MLMIKCPSFSDVLFIKQKGMGDRSIWGTKRTKNCQRCGKEMKRAAKYCIACRKEVDKELQAGYREERKAFKS